MEINKNVSFKQFCITHCKNENTQKSCIKNCELILTDFFKLVEKYNNKSKMVSIQIIRVNSVND